MEICSCWPIFAESSTYNLPLRKNHYSWDHHVPFRTAHNYYACFDIIHVDVRYPVLQIRDHNTKQWNIKPVPFCMSDLKYFCAGTCIFWYNLYTLVAMAVAAIIYEKIEIENLTILTWKDYVTMKNGSRSTKVAHCNLVTSTYLPVKCSCFSREKSCKK